MKKFKDFFEGKKTYLYAAVSLVLSFVPGVGDFIKNHPSEWAALNSAIIAAIRSITVVNK